MSAPVPPSADTAQPSEPINAVSLRTFDPHRVPVVAVDSALPAVELQRLTAQALRERFAHPPPWTPEVRLALSNSFGFGGNNCVLVLGRGAEPTS